MGDGLVLESGTHDELLSGNGAYAALVQAQKLRESNRTVAEKETDSVSDETEDLEKAIREEVPLGRKNTSRSLASEILEQKRVASQQSESKASYSMFYLFRRMGLIMRDHWPQYFYGASAACRKSDP